MRTISRTVDDLLAASPVFADALGEGIVNISSLARKLRPQVKARLLEDVTVGAVAMALRRSARAKRQPQVPPFRLMNVTVRSDLTDFSFQNSPTLHRVHERLLALTEEDANLFLNFVQGFFQTTILVSGSIAPLVEKMVRGEKLLERIDDLSAISFTIPREVVPVPGIYSRFLRSIAAQKINVVEFFSAYAELSLVVARADADRVFALIQLLDQEGG